MLGVIRPVQRPPSLEQQELAVVDFGWVPATVFGGGHRPAAVAARLLPIVFIALETTTAGLLLTARLNALISI